MFLNKTKTATVIDRLIVACIFSFILLFVIKCISVSLTTRFTFDGAMNVQVAQNLVNHHKYATSYDGLHLFDPRVQTGITVTLPVAIFFKIFGESFESGLSINAIYLILLLFSLIYYLKYCLRSNNYFVLLAILVFLGTPKLFSLGFGLLGEIPALFYFLISIIFLHKFYGTSKAVFVFYSGIFVALSYLTKTVMLISIPAILFVMVLDNIGSIRSQRRINLTPIALFIVGFFTPLFIFELYKFHSLGPAAYSLWWSDQANAILKQAGLSEGFADTTGIIAKALKHLGLLASYININEIIIVIFIIILITFSCAIIFHIYGKRKMAWRVDFENIFGPTKELLILLLVTLSYLGWWILITPTEKTWYRRVINGVILYEFCVVIFIYFIYAAYQKRVQFTNKRSIKYYEIGKTAIPMIILAVCFLNINNTGNLNITFDNEEDKTWVLETGNFIDKLPEESEFFGVGWWQAPNIAFVSGKNFNDINHSQETHIPGYLDDKYLVVDVDAHELDPGAYEAVLLGYDYQLVFSNEENFVYKLIYRKQ